jgi:hypothetical protein
MSAAYTIHVDGVAYGGIDPDGEDSAQDAGLGTSFHNYNSGGRDALKWGGEPYVIEANINVKSHLDRILARMRDGTLDAQEIVIRRVTP